MFSAGHAAKMAGLFARAQKKPGTGPPAADRSPVEGLAVDRAVRGLVNAYRLDFQSLVTLFVGVLVASQKVTTASMPNEVWL